LEEARPERQDGYAPIAQYDHTYRQTSGVHAAADENPTYAEVVAAGSAQPKNSAGFSAENPPSYSAIVKGGISFS
jgi:hypothetical protein